MVDWLMTALAAWRLAHLLVNEDGPGAVFARLRYRAGVRVVPAQTADGQLMTARVAQTSLAQGLTCVWCVSLWTAGGLWALWALWPPLGRALATWLALSALAILWHEVLQCLRSRSG